jgi:hypothetical protein
MTFVLGHVFYLKAIHGAKQKTTELIHTSNRACGFPAHGFPMLFIVRHAPLPISLLSALYKDQNHYIALLSEAFYTPPSYSES